jgi:hypothetical protein
MTAVPITGHHYYVLAAASRSDARQQPDFIWGLFLLTIYVLLYFFTSSFAYIEPCDFFLLLGVGRRREEVAADMSSKLRILVPVKRVIDYAVSSSIALHS